MPRSATMLSSQTHEHLIQPFRLDVPQSALDDLKSRLARTRWPDELPGTGADYGAVLGFVTETAQYWRTTFDWRASPIVHWSQFDRGGHFAAMDAPDLLIGDLRAFFRRFR